ncbi:MAG TPA: restriction endonuclease [Patescibacteria group bacterium]
MYTPGPYQIVKASGEQEDFSEAKLVRSLATSGMSVSMANQTLEHIKKDLRPGISTHDIFNDVSTYLRENAPIQNYFNYGLKRAMMRLGPSGHPFERLIGDLLEAMGYETQVSVTLGGNCVTHEIDVIAVKEKKTYFIECKYHNQPGTRSDVQVALYTYARFLDIQKAMQAMFDADKTYHPWLTVNTKLTYDAVDYSKCMNIKTTTWSFPKDESLHKMIVDTGIHPITVLDSLPEDKLQLLLGRNIVTCARLKAAIDHDSVSDILSVGELTRIEEDIKAICQTYGEHHN